MDLSTLNVVYFQEYIFWAHCSISICFLEHMQAYLLDLVDYGLLIKTNEIMRWLCG